MAIIVPSLSFTYLDAVNRVLAANGILNGDTDLLTTLQDLQHKATSRLAQIAIQDELNDLISDNLLPSERDSTGSITTEAGVQTYSLPSTFIRFFETPMLYCSADNRQLYEYPGGEDTLRLAVFNYATQQGDPSCWYFYDTTSKKIAFYPVPQDAKTYTFDFQADAALSNATDTLPFHNNSECQAFCRMASRRFKLLYEGMDPALLASDPEHVKAKATVFNLVIGKNPPKSWAPIYR